MTASEPPAEQLPRDDDPGLLAAALDDPELLAAALDHAWAWYDGRTSRALQIIGFYLIAAGVTAAAYTSAITSNDNGTAVTVAIFALAFTAIASAAALGEVNAASKAVLPLAELQDRVAGRLHIDKIRMVNPKILARQRRFGAPVSIGLALALNISALIYALIQ